MVAPTLPLVGFIVMEALTEKVADAELDDESVAVTVWAPNDDAGTLKDAVKEPRPSVVVVVWAVEP
jgi:hypothetical protein